MLSKYQINRKVGIKIKMISIREVTVKYNSLGVPDSMYKGVIRQTDSYVTRLVIDLTDIPGDIINVGLNAKKDDGSTNKDGLIVCHPIVGQVKKYYVDINNWYTNIPGTLELTVQALSSMNGLTQVFNCSKINFAIEGTAIELDETVTPESYTVLSINNQTGVVEITHESVGDGSSIVKDNPDNPNAFKFKSLKGSEHIDIIENIDNIVVMLNDAVTTDIELQEAIDGLNLAIQELLNTHKTDLTAHGIDTLLASLNTLSNTLQTHADNNNAHDLASLRSTVSGLVTAVGNLQTVVGSGGADADVIINKLAEVYEFLADFEENDDLLAMINSKLDEVVVEGGEEETGKYVSAVKRDETDKNKIVVEKKDLPQGFSGDYNDLENKPTLFSGSYNDLTNKPTIPSKTSDLENDSGFITEEDLPPEYDDSELRGKIDNINDTKIPSLIKNIQLLSNGVFRVTKYDNTYFDIDTKLEKVVTNFTYNATTKNLELSLDDSTVLTIPMSAFIDDYSGSEGTQFVVNVSSENVISVTMKDGTVTYNQLAQAVKDKLDSIENKVDLFWCTKGTTTYEEITQALNAGKLPVLMYMGNLFIFNSGAIGTEYYRFASSANVDTSVLKALYITPSNTWSALTGVDLQLKRYMVQEIGETHTEYDYPSVNAVKNYVDDALGDLPDVDLSNYYNKTEIDNMIGDIESLLEGI